ncbi:hypothetical protein [Flectobacillus roseus]|uniref:Uncharacterized protein n=1 Tax=Flectobacillus roseus TaxID=502259 RepID=A0ABT6Y361_9BACT|nr:hypothetical protein [Flectobacillus roseus]MDI9858004.1 hypothetical protein [Flectobacillus roseus]
MYTVRRSEVVRLEKLNQEDSAKEPITVSEDATPVDSMYQGFFVYASPALIFIENVVFLYLMYKFIQWLIKK